MDFFGAQARSRRNTRTLVFLFSLATLAVVGVVTFAFHLMTSATTDAAAGLDAAHENRVIAVALGTLVFIGLASLYRIASLRSGGARVARDLGGVEVHADDRDRYRRRLYNVVEEMSIASGVPIPRIFVLERESGINAFAAGFDVDDAAVAVTDGALRHFSRDELQGVIAHEFSHVLNGDMRLNIRLMGPLFGILALALAGRMVLRGFRPVRVSSRKGSGGGAALVFAMGMVLIITGYVGVFFARLIKAGVSRQREFLADASAVQFTRQTDGIANALKRIGGFDLGSGISSPKGEEVSHMLFATGSRSSSWFATHPPLEDRIRALDHTFDADRSRGVDASTPAPDGRPVSGFAAGSERVAMSAAAAFQSIGNPDRRHVALAREIRADLDDDLDNAIHDPMRASGVLLALVLSPDHDRQHAGQIDIVARRHGHAVADDVVSLHGLLPPKARGNRLSLVLIAGSTLRGQAHDHVDYLIDTMNELASFDAEIDLFEFTVIRVARTILGERAHASPVRRKSKVLRSAAVLLAALADHGHSEPAEARAALAAGMRHLGASVTVPVVDDGIGVTHRELDEALMTLEATPHKVKPVIVEALVHTVLVDDHVSQAEAELLRAVCIIFSCPMPPLLDEWPEPANQLNQ